MKTTVQNIARRLPLLTIFLTAASLAVHIFHPIRPHLLYTRADLLNGEFWRLVACHWVHLNTDHLLWSAMTYLLLGSFCEIMDRKRYAGTIGFSAIFIPSGIWFGAPQLQVYGGLSGLDCALYALLITLFIRREGESPNRFFIILYVLMLALLPAKIIYEMSSGLTIFVSNNHSNMVPVPLSHLIGGMVGFLVGACDRRLINFSSMLLWTCISSIQHVNKLGVINRDFLQLQKKG